MVTGQWFGITIGELKNDVGVHGSNDTHGIFFVEAGDSSGEVMSVFVKTGGLDGFGGALIVLEGDSAFLEWVSGT
jgi:hypothetical protein